MMILPHFIVFEGIDGAGTSTQIERLQKRLKHKPVFFTAEPTELETGKFLRRILKGDISVTSETAARLFAADRSEHVYGTGGIIEPCNAGRVCICDRYVFSSLAYQSIECGMQLPQKLNEDFPLPQIVFYFRIQPEQSLKRIAGRSVTEIYEKTDFLKKTATSYETVFDTMRKTQCDMRIIDIDASLSADEVEKNIWTVISSMPILNT